MSAGKSFEIRNTDTCPSSCNCIQYSLYNNPPSSEDSLDSPKSTRLYKHREPPPETGRLDYLDLDQDTVSRRFNVPQLPLQGIYPESQRTQFVKTPRPPPLCMKECCTPGKLQVFFDKPKLIGKCQVVYCMTCVRHFTYIH